MENKDNLKLAVILVFLLVLGMGGYYIFQNKTKQKEPVMTLQDYQKQYQMDQDKKDQEASLSSFKMESASPSALKK